LLELSTEVKMKTLDMTSLLAEGLIRGVTATKRLNLAYQLTPGDYQNTQIEILESEVLSIHGLYIEQRNEIYKTISFLHAKLGIFIANRIHQL
jgi:hypothetical protein